jgi:hypothetical protein
MAGDMGDLEALEQIAEQTSIRVNKLSRGGKFGWASTNTQRASVQREKKKTPKPPKKRMTKKKAPKPAAARSPPSPARVAAVGQLFTGYSTLIETCRVRCDQLALSRAELDRLSGLPEGYSAKLLGGDGCGPRQKRAWPISLDAMLGALGLAVILIEDEAATARTLARREKPVDRSQQRFGSAHWRTRLLPPPEEPGSSTNPCSAEAAA